MKNIRLLLISFFSFAIILSSCNKDKVEPIDVSSLPTNFKVDIPSSINKAATKAYKEGDGLNGNIMYLHLTNFIHIGNEAAIIVEEIIKSISKNGLSQEGDFTFTGDDDGREKHVVITTNSDFEGTTWQYQLTMTDKLSESEEDGGIAMQIFWNKGTIKGVSILKPYNIDRNIEELLQTAMFRIDYSEATENGYEQEMTVYISDMELPSPLVNPYAINSLKMNVGKKGNIVEVYGNSSHPNAKFFNNDVGFNWAFVAAGEEDTNIGIAEVGLPPCTLNTDNRTTILKTNSLNAVFIAQIIEVWPELDPITVAQYLKNTEAPGYFNSNGFVQGGTSPGSEYGNIETAIASLSPYNPSIITNMHVTFKNATAK